MQVGLICIDADRNAANPMSSGDLIPGDHDQPEPASNEVQFALVNARMIDTVKNSPEDMRQAVYDLARYKLREQFTHMPKMSGGRSKRLKARSGASRNAQRSRSALRPRRRSRCSVTALRPAISLPPDLTPPAATRPHLELNREPVAVKKPGQPPLAAHKEGRGSAGHLCQRIGNASV
jgi:hypothetical protein